MNLKGTIVFQLICPINYIQLLLNIDKNKKYICVFRSEILS